jgi:trehalose 2-sulfotransferase
VMAFTNRSGSHLLAEYMLQTGRFRGLGEWLNLPVVTEFAKTSASSSLPEYLRWLAAHLGAGPDSDLGINASAEQLSMLVRHGLLGMFAGVRIVHMRRQDLIGQAVSFHIANQTQRWTSRHPSSIDSQDVPFDARQIDAFIQSIQKQNAQIEVQLALLDCPKATVTYEDLTDTPGPVLRRLGRNLGVDLQEWRPVVPRLEKQSDTRNLAMVEEFQRLSRQRLRRGGP